jgi:hypothetical protein
MAADEDNAMHQWTRGGRTALVAVLAGAMLAAGSAAASDPPDFSGVWTSFGGGGFGARWPQNAPLTAEARDKVAEYRRLIEGTGATPGGFCVGTGMPGSMLGSGGYPMEILQRPEQITIIYEAHTEIRRVYMDGRDVDPDELFPTRNGFSTGYWDGDTLVIETFALKEQVDQAAAHSEEARIVERYSLSRNEQGRRIITAELTMTDPAFYTEPVTVTKQWAELPNGRMLHYECTEPDWEDFLDDRRRIILGR